MHGVDEGQLRQALPVGDPGGPAVPRRLGQCGGDRTLQRPEYPQVRSSYRKKHSSALLCIFDYVLPVFKSLAQTIVAAAFFFINPAAAPPKLALALTGSHATQYLAASSCRNIPSEITFACAHQHSMQAPGLVCCGLLWSGSERGHVLAHRVISIHNNPENLQLPAKYLRLQFSLADVDTQDISPFFAPSYDFIEEARAAGQGA